MGYELYREVKVWAPDGLTKGEKLAALVLADDANDKTRETYHSVVDPEIMRQALVPDDRAMRRIVAKLQDWKVLEHAGGGHNGRTAKYRFLHLAPAGSAMEGENHPATDDVAGQKSPGNSKDGRPNGENHPPTDGVAGRFSASSRVETTRPTPSASSTTSSSTKSAGKPASHATTAPDSFPLDERMYDWAAAKGLNRDRVHRETEQFLDYHRAKGTKNRDWNAAWRNWMRKAIEFSSRAQTQRPSGHQPYLNPTDRNAYDEDF